MPPKKSLGQHWLTDEAALQAVVAAANLTKTDTVLEVGPGLGSLTTHLTKVAQQVIAVELDDDLAADLPAKFTNTNLTVVNDDILNFDLTSLPIGYKVVANIPYYLTANLLRTLAESANPPAIMALLVQKEVAQRIAAAPGDMSLLALSLQLDYKPILHRVVPASLFTPPPKVDSQIIALHRHAVPSLSGPDRKVFFRLAKAGFGERRKKLRSSLAGGLKLTKPEVDKLLKSANLAADARAQELSLADWGRLYQAFTKSLVKQ